MLKLSKDDRRQLREAIQLAYPSLEDLTLFVAEEFNTNLSSISAGGPYSTVIFNLIQGEIAKGNIDELIWALARNTQNSTIQRFCSRVLQRLLLRRIPRSGQGYIEPLLDVGSALPLHMVLIPGGTFTMGSPEDEPERITHRESPQHDVTIPQFFMGHYPVTQTQWQAVAAMPEIERKLDPEPSHFKGKDNHPVEQVSWGDVVEFCARLKKHTNRPYRLPSEAEWEYACRAGTTTPFYFGKTLTDELANYRASETYASGPTGEYHRQTTAVDYFGIANAFGLSDMHGNVFEWCQDHWCENYDDASRDGSAWLTDDESAFRVYRGGSWCDSPRHCRSAYRYDYDPDSRDTFIGFRVCCSGPKTL